jgi:hypothetical protein
MLWSPEEMIEGGGGREEEEEEEEEKEMFSVKLFCGKS